MQFEQENDSPVSLSSSSLNTLSSPGIRITRKVIDNHLIHALNQPGNRIVQALPFIYYVNNLIILLREAGFAFVIQQQRSRNASHFKIIDLIDDSKRVIDLE
ncbi:8867_t:CDS:1 [Ambispora leptoticha]|uniref:8867_t:CDS:1 n=1 Tax=Ambispora leptoticha TaxID=144679 RepID=A0A9N9FXE0_9GLOM|nr:8867_t:CDS:1 [Ambispora leptoticha]